MADTTKQPGPGDSEDGVPARTRTRFPGISSRAYEHPADRSALVALRKLNGFDAILKQLSGLLSERAVRLMFLAGAVRTSDQQFRRLHDLARDAAYVLDMPRVPELYVMLDPQPNAMAIGMDKPFIVVTSGLVELLDDDEMRTVVGHEMGHILSGHAVYRTMLLILTNLAASVSGIPLGTLGIQAVIAALREWFRKSELSCDRAGLLVGQDPEASMRALMKIAGGSQLHEMSTDEFLAQAAEYDAAGDLRDSVLKLMNVFGRSHPFPVVRVAELKRWSDGDDYRAILAGDYPRREDDGDASVRAEAKASAESYRDSVRQTADPLFGLLRDIAGGAADAGGRLRDRFVPRPNDGTATAPPSEAAAAADGSPDESGNGRAGSQD
ncbi:M48 family metallopeptidase [Yinghuangia seranimata]|uniref:M48 family metallopeptidase n=1 Tax=Yinghuangia seranimata TaxID=408067 RepID=UPI00248BB416|nr:M48 family metallopeptidase [Yinghuangia seranimata]MDI2127409.1 M48 family metallopeptidase [Yinghuangia seranimata]